MGKKIEEILDNILKIAKSNGYENIDFVDAKIKLKDNLENVYNIKLDDQIEDEES